MTLLVLFIVFTMKYSNISNLKVYLPCLIYLIYYRDMCSAEDTELQTSALKLRGGDQQITKKSTCCSKS